ncbi:MAG: ATP-binding cassette domain-containing protein [Clostridia bacterium]|nr:ATP-binding cassette domain-containing protein [Clostridia bacterium]
MIEITGLTKRYGDIEAVKGISFTVNDGEILGFLGPNGAGKSTTLNIMTGCLSATDGSVKIDGCDILEDPIEAKKKIGFLPEQPPLYGDMTVNEYLSFVYELKKCKLPKKQHIKEICDLVKLNDVFNRLIRNLSKGYRQRVGIAQALIGNPKAIVLDEPTVGLDPRQIIEIRNLIKMLGRDHTVIISTHILPEVQAVCDRVVVINKGVVVANEKTEDLTLAVSGARKLEAKIVGPQDEVLKELKSISGIRSVEVLGKLDTDSVTYVIESEGGVDIRKPLFFALSRKGWALIGLEGAELNLEDIFLRLVDMENERKVGKRTTGRTMK